MAGFQSESLGIFDDARQIQMGQTFHNDRQKHGIGQPVRDAEQRTVRVRKLWVGTNDKDMPKATMGMVLAGSIRIRASKLLPLATASGKYFVMRRMACNAYESVNGVARGDASASMAWVNASKPVNAVILGGRPTVSSGSSTAMSALMNG